MKKNKILFINPPISYNSKAKYTNFKMPLGFMYMASLLEKNNFLVKILDCPLDFNKKRRIDSETAKFGAFPEEIEKIILDFSPDIVGVSCAYTAYESDSFEVIEIVKKASARLKKDILIVIGGAHTSANPHYVLRNKNIDIAVIGEGEETMLEIAKRFSAAKSLKNIKGTAFANKKKIKINPPREYIQNLDGLWPAYHLLDMEKYFSHPDNSKATLRRRSVDIITSRGCPARCVFCSIHTVWGRIWRGRSAKDVVDEIEFLIKKYNVRQLRMQDDNLTFDRKRILDICNEIIRRKIDIKWDTPNGVALWALDKEVIKRMKLAGCYRITFGIESSCKKTQKYIRKILDIEKIKKFIDTCHKHHLWICSTFIIGFPYEKKEDIEDTRSFILNSGINFPFVYVAQPLMGTDMYNDFKKENLLKNIKTASNISISKYNTVYFTSNNLNSIRNKIYKEFYFRTLLRYSNPIIFYREFLSKIRAQDDLRYIAKTVFTLLFDKFV